MTWVPGNIGEELMVSESGDAGLQKSIPKCLEEEVGRESRRDHVGG